MSRPPLICLDGIAFAYAPDRPVLADLDFAVHQGERVALLGGNGAGKTTVLHIIVGLLRPQSGTVTAFGMPRRRERDFYDVRARVGLLFQDPDDQLFCPSVGEDVAFGPRNLGRSPAEAEAIAAATLARLGLAGYAPRITHRLSGGEKRLVALACVLAMAPEVLLLDEPTAGLDKDAWDRLSACLAALPQAMVIVSHDRAFRDRLATRSVRLAGGRLTPTPP